MKTEWGCELCGKTGVIETNKDTGVWEGYQKVTDSHKQTSPRCEGSLYDIRVKLLEEK